MSTALGLIKRQQAEVLTLKHLSYPSLRERDKMYFIKNIVMFHDSESHCYGGGIS